MWKRLQGHGRDKEKQTQIGNPVLLETTYDEDQLRRNPRVADIQSGHRDLPNVPGSRRQESLLPPAPPNNRVSEVSVSSVYSRPSQDLTYYTGNPTATTPGYDISPPSSPEPEKQSSAPVDQPRRFRSMRDVSPMDEHRKKFEGSSIPVLRRAPPELKSGEQSGPKQKFWGGKVEPNGKVKWDAYSGEPSKAGKAASVTPASYSQAAPPDRRAMGYKVSVTGPEAQRKVGFSDRLERLGSKSPPAAVDTASRQPWARTSGRSEIASPLKDDPNSKPLQIPRKQMSPTSMAPRGRVTARDVAPDTKTVARETSDTRDGDAHNDLIKPVVPLKAGRNSPFTSGLASPTSPTHPGIGINSYPSPVTPTNQYSAPDAIKTVTEQSTASLPPSQRSETPPYNAADSTQPVRTLDKGKQPTDSRFSWTTYNSNTTYQHSPPPSPPPPLPTSTTKQGNRPTPVTDSKSAANTTSSSATRRADPMPARKPIGMPFVVPDTPITPVPPGTARIHTTLSARISDPPSPSAISTFSSGTGYSKALPVPPTTLSAGDHISVLESQMEDLRIRRGNVYRLLQDLNNAAPPNPLITDFRRARLVEQRKRSFEDELNEIKREEYEIGMKLHRAWKKREKEDPNTGSALWIRRVTS